MTEPPKKIDPFKLAMELPDWVGYAATEAVEATHDVRANVAEARVTVEGRQINVIRCRGKLEGRDGVWCYVHWEDKAVCLVERPAGWGVRATVGLKDGWEPFVKVIREISAKLSGEEVARG